MTPARALVVIHNLDVPEDKRRYWPQWATVVVGRGGVIEDVIQHFEPPDEFLHRRQLEIYPYSVQFTATAGETYLTVESLLAKVDECARMLTTK